MKKVDTQTKVAQTLEEGLEWYRQALQRQNFIILESLQPDEENHCSYIFIEPVHTIQTAKPAEVAAKLQEVEQSVEEGCYAAGYLAYEAGYGLDTYWQEELPDSHGQLLLYFGIFAQRYCIDFTHIDLAQWRRQTLQLLNQAGKSRLENVSFSLNEEEYCRRLAQVKAEIAAGNTYQINFTFDIQFTLAGSADALYGQLREKQRAPYAGYLRQGDLRLLSLSPELFFRQEGRRIAARPMKGTAARGCTRQEDEAAGQRLAGCPKNRAENAMIVDLLRNDLGKLSVPGSVQCSRLFAIERYETVLQMTSTVESQLLPGQGLTGIMKGLFPCGSITGAPKLSSMDIIRRLENRPRGVYTGTLGHLAPDGTACFNIPIRTAELLAQQGRMGIGSGVVWDSEGGDEYQECCRKGQFLLEEEPGHKLLETMLYEDGCCSLLPRHLKRLEQSAVYFNFSYDRRQVETALTKNAAALAQGCFRVRLALDSFGGMEITNVPCQAPASRWFEAGLVPVKLAVAKEKTQSGSVWVYHKTTRRELYDRLYKEATAAGLADYIFCNERGEVTEGCIHNLFIRQGQEWLTPSLACGLLPGVMRAKLLAAGSCVRETVLTLEQLAAAEEIYVCNSVRGVRRAVLLPE